jgi:hypothetical protein
MSANDECDGVAPDYLTLSSIFRIAPPVAIEPAEIDIGLEISDRTLDRATRWKIKVFRLPEGPARDFDLKQAFNCCTGLRSPAMRWE